MSQREFTAIARHVGKQDKNKIRTVPKQQQRAVSMTAPLDYSIFRSSQSDRDNFQVRNDSQQSSGSSRLVSKESSQIDYSSRRLRGLSEWFDQ
jgi:hypothetical protein